MSRVSLPTTRFTVPEFERMVEADLFGTTRIELINGRVYHMSPQNDPHLFSIAKINRALSRLVPSNESLFANGTIRLDAFTVVDPDFMWVAAPIGTPEHERPKPVLIIEVSATTYKRDSGVKLRAYAKFGIVDYWIVNVRASHVEVYRKPANPTGLLADCQFESVMQFGRGQTISLLQRPEVALSVEEMLP